MKREISMQVIHSHAAGIDVGSRSHFVAIGQNPGDVSEFGVYTQDHQQLIEWLNGHGITTIAMESTGSYWQTLFSALQRAGFEVLLVNGRQIKNVKGKTDVKDCQWIQRLHCLGLLTGSFLPSEQLEQLRTYQRHRNWLVEQCSKLTNKMQKALRLMNVRLDVAINDIMGKSGQLIIKSILEGNHNGEQLASLADPRVKKSKQEIAMALEGNWREEHLFELRDCYELYKMFELRLTNCDLKTEVLLSKFTKDIEDHSTSKTTKSKRRYKNEPKFDVSSLSTKILGVDLFAIDGISHSTVMTFLSEVGEDIYKFPSAKQFASWMRLAPNNRISGGKTISSRTPKGKNRLALALRNAANSIGQMKKSSLKNFFGRIAYKKGRAAAITATARKLAVIIWNMVVKQQPFRPMDEMLYQEKVKASVIFNIKVKMKRLNLSVNDLSLTC
jgi:transposase